MVIRNGGGSGVRVTRQQWRGENTCSAAPSPSPDECSSRFDADAEPHYASAAAVRTATTQYRQVRTPRVTDFTAGAFFTIPPDGIDAPRPVSRRHASARTRSRARGADNRAAAAFAAPPGCRYAAPPAPPDRRRHTRRRRCAPDAKTAAVC